jgi:hypothetical protein
MYFLLLYDVVDRSDRRRHLSIPRFVPDRTVARGYR